MPRRRPASHIACLRLQRQRKKMRRRRLVRHGAAAVGSLERTVLNWREQMEYSTRGDTRDPPTQEHASVLARESAPNGGCGKPPARTNTEKQHTGSAVLLLTDARRGVRWGVSIVYGRVQLRAAGEGCIPPGMEGPPARLLQSRRASPHVPRPRRRRGSWHGAARPGRPPAPPLPCPGPRNELGSTKGC